MCDECGGRFQHWPDFTGLTHFGEQQPERPLYAKFDPGAEELSRAWTTIDAPSRASELLSSNDDERIRQLCREVSDERDYMALPALLELSRRDVTRGWRGTVLLPIWELCSKDSDGSREGGVDEMAGAAVRGHEDHLVDIVLTDSWEAAHHAGQILILVGIPNGMRARLKREASRCDRARQLLEVVPDPLDFLQRLGSE